MPRQVTRKHLLTRYLTNIGPSSSSGTDWHAKGYQIRLSKVGKLYKVEVWWGPVERKDQKQAEGFTGVHELGDPRGITYI